jgi:poly-gamma-glutamate capsule biosynthesis protein CapA/YwtB (metallophosphatase superfamily)
VEAIKLFLSGDVMTGRGIDQVLPWPCEPTLYEPFVSSAKDYVALAEAANGPLPRPVDVLYPWGDCLAELQHRHLDARIINLETSVTRHSRPEPKGINYRMSPENFSCIKAAEISCCVLANNHVLDWGETGLIETLQTINAAGIATPGAGRDVAEATAPAVLAASGQNRILVYACAFADSGVPRTWLAGTNRPGVNLMPDFSVEAIRRVAAQVQSAKQAGDIVIASIHWGGNWGYAIPSSHRRFAHALIDEAGVDLVHAHSSHHPKAIEVHRGRLILYGCGDFITDYEGIKGYESFRDDLVLMYLPVLSARDGALQRLTMIPFQLRKLRLNRATKTDAEWLCRILHRECRRFGGGVCLDESGSLHFEWSHLHHR